MGFAKYAKARVVKASVGFDAWATLCRDKALSVTAAGKSGKVVLQDYDPKEFLLSHATIIASVDTDSPQGMPLGRQVFEGQEIDRRYPDFYITPETSKFVNNNFDSWERKLLLASFSTFIGGHNYLEHVQIPSMSKGRIIDAAARDLGDTVYVDILVATNKKHTTLIDAIVNGSLSTMSMGAQVEDTTCSKCGNVAADETQLCEHIRYFKGNEFIDGVGKRRKIAEICGHYTRPLSCRFIEASWVENPAFEGAVIRNILSTDDIPGVKGKMQFAFAQTRYLDPTAIQKAARQILGEEQQYPGASDDTQQAKPKEPKEDTDSLDKAVDDLYGELKTKLVERLRKDMSKDEAGKVDRVINENRNENLIKSAVSKDPRWVKVASKVISSFPQRVVARKVLAGIILLNEGGWRAVAASRQFSGLEILTLDRFVGSLGKEKKSSLAGEERIYRTVVAVGGTSPHTNVDAYLAACRQVSGRDLTDSERRLLIVKGHLFSMGS